MRMTLTQHPYSFLNFEAISALYDIITKGPDCGVFKSCIVSTLMAATNREKEMERVQKIIASWKAPEK